MEELFSNSLFRHWMANPVAFSNVDASLTPTTLSVASIFSVVELEVSFPEVNSQRGSTPFFSLKQFSANKRISARSTKLCKVPEVMKDVADLKCSNNCLSPKNCRKILFSLALKKEGNVRELFFCLSKADQNRWLVQQLSSAERKAARVVRISLGDSQGRSLCKKAFQVCFHLPRQRIDMLVKRITDVNYKPTLTTDRKLLRKSLLTEVYCRFFNYFRTEKCEPHPTQPGSVATGLVKRCDLFDEFEDWPDRPVGMRRPKKTLFYQVLRERFTLPKLIFLPRFHGLGRCSDCVLYEQEKRSPDPHTQLAAKAKLDEHRKRFWSERAELQRRLDFCSRRPGAVLPLCIDQSSGISMPQEGQPLKSHMRSKRLTHEVVGVLEAGNRSKIILYPNLWPNDPNLTLTLLVHHIHSSLGHLKGSENRPHVLMLNVDNNRKENKNSTMLGLAQLLVELDWFGVVFVSFLIAGVYVLLFLIKLSSHLARKDIRMIE